MAEKIVNWKTFLIGNLFEIKPTKSYANLSKEEIVDGGTIPLVLNSGVNNGIGGYSTLSPTEKGGIITFSDTTDGNTFFYQPRPFIGFSHVQGMYPRNREWSENECLFLITLLTFVTRGRYNYGRKMTRTNISNTKILLPAKLKNNRYIIDFEYMNRYVDDIKNEENHTFGSLKTAISIDNKKNGNKELEVKTWAKYTISELFEVRYGINIDLNKCEETDEADQEAVNYVSRTSENNGVTARVKLIEGKEPQVAGLITCAGGGSVLSTFLQEEPFYSGRDLYLLIPKYSMSRRAKLFIITVIEANKYRYNYGRQANITLPNLELNLPTKGSCPDWDFMDSYISNLPYGDKLGDFT